MSDTPPTLHGLVVEAASPDDAPAVRYTGLESDEVELLSYGEMRRMARRLCGVLRSVSCPVGSPVALFCEPAVSLPALVLGVLQAGSAFAPLDPTAPPALSLHFLRQSGAKLALVEQSRMQTFSSIFGEYLDISSLNSGCPVVGAFLLQLHVKQKQPVNFSPSATHIDIGAKKSSEKVHQCEEMDDDGDWNQNDNQKVLDKSDLTSFTEIDELKKKGSLKYSEERLPAFLSSDAHQDIDSSRSGVLKASTLGTLAYVLHTSGTTGVPKIVRVPHCCIVPNIIHLRSLFGVSSQDVVFMAAPLTFDPSIVEMFVALSSGASLIAVHPQVKMNPQRLADVMFKENKVTVLQATPTLMQQFGSQILRSVVLAEHSSLRVLALGGEPFPPLDVLRSWRSLSNGTRIFNLYGVTEVSSWASCWEVPPQVFTDSADMVIHLGPPLLGTKMEVRGPSGQPIVDGEGQLFIGGQQRVCFLGDEVEVAMGTMRPSGDHVYVSGGLNYFFVGRQDGQRKRHGKRLELGSVERAAVCVPGVEASAAVLLEDQRLGLCVVPENCLHREHDQEQSRFLEEKIFCHLRQFLPSHAVPDFIIFIDRLPATQHGKISVGELVSLCGRVKSRDVTRQGRRELQPLLWSCWQKALPGVVPKEDPQLASRFLSCGGDSLRAVQFAADLEVQLEHSLPDVLQLILSNTFDEIYRYCQRVVDLKTKESVEQYFSKVDGNTRSVEAGGQLDGEILNAGSSVGSADAIAEVAAIMEGHFERPSSLKESSEVLDSMEGRSKVLDSMEGSIQDVDIPESQKTNLQTKRKLKDRNLQGKRQRQEIVNIKHQNGNNIPTDIPMETIKSESMHSFTPATEAVLAVSRANRATVIHGVNLETLFDNCEHDLVIATRKLEGSEQKEAQTVDPVEIEMSEVWHFDTGRCVDASPLILVSRGKAVLILGSHSHWLFCLDLHTGHQIWRARLGGRVESSACVTTSGKHVSVGCYDGGVYVLCLSTGTVCWVFRTGDSVKSSPVLDPVSGWLLVGSHDKHVYALDTQAHRCAWSLPAGSSVFSSPCVGDSPHRAYVGTLGGLLLSLDPLSGLVVWSHDCGKPLFSSPSCALGLVCVGCVDGSLLALNTSGEELWRFCSSKPFFSSPCLLPDMTEDPNLNLSVLCGCHDGYLYLLSGNGQLLWSRWLGAAVYSSPCARWLGNVKKPMARQSETLEVISEATVTMKPMDRKIARGASTEVTGWRFVAATTEGVVYILDGDGKVLSQYVLPGELFSSPILHGDRLLVGCRDDNIYCLCSPTLGPSCQEWWTLVDGMFTSAIAGPKPHSNSSASPLR